MTESLTGKEFQEMLRNYWLSEGLRGIRERNIVYVRAYRVRRLSRGWAALMQRLFPQ